MLSKATTERPIVFLMDLKLNILKALLAYIYQGEVQVDKADLLEFMRAAEFFKIKGLQSEESVYSLADEVMAAEEEQQPVEIPIEEVNVPAAKKLKVKHEPEKPSSSKAIPEISIGGCFEIKEDIDSLEPPNEILDGLRTYLKDSDEGPGIVEGFNLNGILSEKQKEKLLELTCEFVRGGISDTTYSKKTREAVAEAVLGLFPGIFVETYVSSLPPFFSLRTPSKLTPSPFRPFFRNNLVK